MCNRRFEVEPQRHGQYLFFPVKRVLYEYYSFTLTRCWIFKILNTSVLSDHHFKDFHRTVSDGSFEDSFKKFRDTIKFNYYR